MNLARLLFYFRTAIAVLHALRPVTSPHVWRQVDTLAVAFRYYQRWTVGAPSGWKALLPAVLNSGDAVGYAPMEFPLLNLLGAPAFVLGIDGGRIVAHLLSLALTVGLVLANVRVWRGRTLFGVAAETWLYLLPCFSIALGFFAKFMPDLAATLFVLLAVGLVWEERSAKRTAAALIATAIGVLIKPTACGCAGLILLVHDQPFGILRRAWPLVAGTAIAFIYYTAGMTFLRAYQDVIPHFAVEPRPPLTALREFLSEPLTIADLVNYHAFVPWAPVLFIGVWLARRMDFGWRIVLCLFAQTLFLAALSGKHVYIHVYYFMAMAPTLTLLALKLLHESRSRIVATVFCLLVTSRVVEASISDLGGYLDPESHAALFDECAALRRAQPDFGWGEGKAFRSTPEDYPLLGLCFGERQDSQVAPQGFFYGKSGVPAGCTPRQTGAHITLADCKTP